MFSVGGRKVPHWGVTDRDLKRRCDLEPEAVTHAFLSNLCERTAVETVQMIMYGVWGAGCGGRWVGGARVRQPSSHSSLSPARKLVCLLRSHPLTHELSHLNSSTQSCSHGCKLCGGVGEWSSWFGFYNGNCRCDVCSAVHVFRTWESL